MLEFMCFLLVRHDRIFLFPVRPPTTNIFTGFPTWLIAFPWPISAPVESLMTKVETYNKSNSEAFNISHISWRKQHSVSTESKTARWGNGEGMSGGCRLKKNWWAETRTAITLHIILHTTLHKTFLSFDWIQSHITMQERSRLHYQGWETFLMMGLTSFTSVYRTYVDLSGVTSGNFNNNVCRSYDIPVFKPTNKYQIYGCFS